MPHGRARDPAVSHTEHAARDPEQAVEDLPELEVRTQSLRIKRVRLGPHEFRVVIQVPALQGLRPRDVLTFPGEQFLDVVPRAGFGDGGDLRHERLRRGCGPDHLVRSDVVGEVIVVQEARELVSLPDEPRKDLEVRGMRPVQVLLHEVVADRVFPGVAEHGDGVGVVRRDRDRAVVPGRMRLHEIVGQALEVRGPDVDRANVLADGLVKLLADRGDLVPQRLDAGARRIVAVDARQVKVSEDLLDGEAGGRGLAGDVQRREGVVHIAVQAQFRGEPVRFLIRLVSRLTHRGVRMHIEEELRLRQQLFEPA